MIITLRYPLKLIFHLILHWVRVDVFGKAYVNFIAFVGNIDKLFLLHGLIILSCSHCATSKSSTCSRYGLLWYITNMICSFFVDVFFTNYLIYSILTIILLDNLVYSVQVRHQSVFWIMKLLRLILDSLTD